VRLNLALILMSLGIFPSCVSRPKVEDLPQCSPVFVYTDDNFIDRQESYCQCRNYRFSKEFVGAVSEVTIHKIDRCDKLVGWETENYVKVARFWDQVRVLINEREKKN